MAQNTLEITAFSKAWFWMIKIMSWPLATQFNLYQPLLISLSQSSQGTPDHTSGAPGMPFRAEKWPKIPQYNRNFPSMISDSLSIIAAVAIHIYAHPLPTPSHKAISVISRDPKSRILAPEAPIRPQKHPKIPHTQQHFPLHDLGWLKSCCCSLNSSLYPPLHIS